MEPLKRHMNQSMNGQPMLSGPQQTPQSSHRTNAHREGRRLHSRGVYMGTFPDGRAVYLQEKHLRTHLHLIGPTGQGKSRMLLWLFELY